MAQITATGSRYGKIPFVRGLSVATAGTITVSVLPVMPATIILTDLTLPKTVTISQVPTVPGGVAPESTYEPLILAYDGVILSDTPEDFREDVEAMLNWLAGEVTLEIFPGRYCNARVSQHTLDPRWPGTNDVFVAFSFQAIVPDGLFYDSFGNTYRTP